jgi:hypothetical protein
MHSGERIGMIGTIKTEDNGGGHYLKRVQYFSRARKHCKCDTWTRNRLLGYFPESYVCAKFVAKLPLTRFAEIPVNERVHRLIPPQRFGGSVGSRRIIMQIRSLGIDLGDA